MSFETAQNHFLPCKMLSCEMPEIDISDPHFPKLFAKVPGDTVNYWKPDFDKGSVMMDMCNEFGIDKWDVIVWYMTWLSMAKKEGLLDDLDFGMEVDVENEEFVRYFLAMITYKKGKLGPVFAEGMARAIRALGKEKYGDTIYHGRFSSGPGRQEARYPRQPGDGLGTQLSLAGERLRGVDSEGRLDRDLSGADDVDPGLPDGGAPSPEIRRVSAVQGRSMPQHAACGRRCDESE